MNSSSKYFTVSDAKGPVCVRGEYRPSVGVAVSLADGYDRSLVESAVRFLFSDKAAVSANLINGWTVSKVVAA